MSVPPDPGGDLSIEPLQEGRACLLPIRAQPGARRAGVLGTWNGRLKVGLRSPPEAGRANEELVGLVAELLGLPRAQVRLVRGQRSRAKTLSVEASPARVRERLLPLLRPER